VGVAEKWGLYRHIRFNSAVSEARWSEKEHKWKTLVKVGGGKEAEYGDEYTIMSDALVSGVGQLNAPYYPDIPGLQSYAGKVMHSARWDWGYDLDGKRVGIIGNGATAAQIIPEVAKVCSSLTVFQRTPNWVIPRGDAEISATMRWIYRFLPAARKRYRAKWMDLREGFFNAAAVEGSEEKDSVREDCFKMMMRQIPDNQLLREELTPAYAPGCKRVIVSDDFFPALNQPNVTLETRPIQNLTPNGLLVDGDSGQHDFDCLVLATGFRTQDFLYPIKIYGLGGRSIEDIWKEAGGPQAYLGVTINSLPNFAMLYGPNTNLGHNSIILMIEAQSRYISTLITPVVRAGREGLTLSIVPKAEVVREYDGRVQERLKESTFAQEDCRSWYKNADGRVTNNWCGTAREYQEMMAVVDWRSYDVEGSGVKLVSSQNREDIGRVVEEIVVPQSVLYGVVASVVLAVAGTCLLPSYSMLS
jgi:cation diffusion facilitator CzcD-associated flavoprotein CzcO